MFEKLKKYFRNQEPPSHTNAIIVTIHGYGRRRKHEFDNFVLWGKAEGLSIVQFDMYDLFDENDCKWQDWLGKARNAVLNYIEEGYQVYVVGFSMGGVIASYLAASFQIERLILLAPAFSYINLDMVGGVISKTAASLWSNEKKEEIKLPNSFYSAFMDIVKNLKQYICKVQCPVLLLHGDCDEVIALKSSTWAYDHIPHERKKLIILHEGHHRLLMDERVNWECYQLMKLFLKGILLPDRTIPQAEDIMEELIKQKQQLESAKKETNA